jgi:hypothetical protein
MIGRRDERSPKGSVAANIVPHCCSELPFCDLRPGDLLGTCWGPAGDSGLEGLRGYCPPLRPGSGSLGDSGQGRSPTNGVHGFSTWFTPNRPRHNFLGRCRACQHPLNHSTTQTMLLHCPQCHACSNPRNSLLFQPTPEVSCTPYEVLCIISEERHLLLA